MKPNLRKMDVSGAVFCMDGDERYLILTFSNILYFTGLTRVQFPPRTSAGQHNVMWQDTHLHTQQQLHNKCIKVNIYVYLNQKQSRILKLSLLEAVFEQGYMENSKALFKILKCVVRVSPEKQTPKRCILASSLHQLPDEGTKGNLTV